MFHLRSLFYRWVCSPHFLPLEPPFVSDAGEVCLCSLFPGERCCSLIDVDPPLAQVVTFLCLWFCPLMHLFSWRPRSSRQIHNLFSGELAPDPRMLSEGHLLRSPTVLFLRMVNQVVSSDLLRFCTCVVAVGQDDGLLSPVDVFFRSISQVCPLLLLWSSACHLVLIPGGSSSLVTCSFLARLCLG